MPNEEYSLKEVLDDFRNETRKSFEDIKTQFTIHAQIYETKEHSDRMYNDLKGRTKDLEEKKLDKEDFRDIKKAVYGAVIFVCLAVLGTALHAIGLY